MPAQQATASYGHRVPACCRMQAFMRGLEADPSSSMLQDALEEVSRTLTLEQVSQVSPCSQALLMPLQMPYFEPVLVDIASIWLYRL